MERRVKQYILLISLIVLFFILNYSWLDKITGDFVSPRGNFQGFRREMPSQINSNISDAENFTIANWNANVFGVKKASDNELMNLYSSVIRNYDIVFLQEIRDESGESFKTLCSSLSSYDCDISSRAGRSSNKEQVGIIYRKGIKIINFTDFNPDALDRWERPPIKLDFEINNYNFTAYNIHTKPTNASLELTNLEKVVSNQGNTIILGDLNADCGYYEPGIENQFTHWNWIISDYDDTSISNSSCAYDRIIINDDAKNEFDAYGIFSKNITSEVSDHYLVWAEFKINESKK